MATMSTKGDIVLLALRKAGMASNATLTEPEPKMVDDALVDLELFITELENRGIYLGFQLSDPEFGPDTNDPHGLTMGDINGIAYNLAKRILTDMLRPVPDSLATQADAAMDALLYRQVAVPSLQRRNDMPVGQGNKNWGEWGRFYIEQKPLTTGDDTPIT